MCPFLKASFLTVFFVSLMNKMCAHRYEQQTNSTFCFVGVKRLLCGLLTRVNRISFTRPVTCLRQNLVILLLLCQGSVTNSRNELEPVWRTRTIEMYANTRCDLKKTKPRGKTLIENSTHSK